MSEGRLYTAKTMESVFTYCNASRIERLDTRHVVVSQKLTHVERVDHMALGFIKLQLLGMLVIVYAVWLLGSIIMPFPHSSGATFETVVYVLATGIGLWMVWRKRSQKLRRLMQEGERQ